MSFFKPSDFYDPEAPDAGEMLAKYCNALLAERGVKVSGSKSGSGVHNFSSYEDRVIDTHQALLVCIEPIIKAPCKHEPLGNSLSGIIPRCKHCSVRLKASWSVAE